MHFTYSTWIKRHLVELDTRRPVIQMPPYINSSLNPYACIMEVLLNYRKGPQQQPQLSGDKALWFKFPLLSEAQERKVELCDITGGYSVVLPGSQVTIHEAKTVLQLPRQILLLTLQRAFLIHVGSLDDGSQFSYPSGNIAYPVLQYTGSTHLLASSSQTRQKHSRSYCKV